jgi:beta-xylosidase
MQVKSIEKWEDPCPYWDEDGQSYLGHSLLGAGPIIIHKMSADGTKLLDEGKTVYTGPVAEGTKIYRRNGYYYISIPEGGVDKGWQTILRSKNIYGPYEKKVVLETGRSNVNGPHQGAMVDTPKGEWWFYHFQSAGAIGRVMHLQPMFWHDDWPVIGIDMDRNETGEPVYVWKKPDVGANFPVCAPRTNDEFDKPALELQWQWNHNPVNSHWSLTEKPGWISLKALKAANLREAPNTLTQKVMGNSSVIITQLDAGCMESGQKAGLSSLSNVFNSVGVRNKEGKLYVFFEKNAKVVEEVAISKKTIYLKLDISLNDQKNHFSYSFDNKVFVPVGTDFEVRWGYWKGTRIALFSYNELNEKGTASFNFFHYNYDGPHNDL